MCDARKEEECYLQAMSFSALRAGSDEKLHKEQKGSFSAELVQVTYVTQKTDYRSGISGLIHKDSLPDLGTLRIWIFCHQSKKCLHLVNLD